MAGALRTWIAAVLAAAACAVPNPVLCGTKTYAIIIGNNKSFERKLGVLKYADDDAARYFELFKAMGAKVKLFTVLDPESQERFPDLVDKAEIPTRKNVLQGVEEILGSIEREKKLTRDGKSVFYFIFSGHGGIGRNYEGYLHLLDGPFTRSDLFDKVLARSTATYNHLILDACQAYFLIASKGGEKKSVPDFRAAIRAYLEQEDIDRFPNTGVVLSSARDMETQEWSLYEAGVFTHELLSALLGGADVDNDGKISYSETRAFLTAANQEVKDPRARLAILARPPAKDVNQPLIDLASLANARILHFSENLHGKFTVEDDRGVRYADLHKAPEGEVDLRLIQARPYYVRTRGKEAKVPPAPFMSTVDVSSLGWRRSIASRGAVQDAFRGGLFAVAFGPTFYTGYRASTQGASLDLILIDGGVPPPLPTLSPTLRPWAWATLGIAVAAGIGAGVTGGLALQSFNKFKAKLADQGLADPDLMTEVENRKLATNSLIAASVAAAAASLVLFLLEPYHGDSRDEDDNHALGLKLFLAPGGLGAGFGLEFTGP